MRTFVKKNRYYYNQSINQSGLLY